MCMSKERECEFKHEDFIQEIVDEILNIEEREGHKISKSDLQNILEDKNDEIIDEIKKRLACLREK